MTSLPKESEAKDGSTTASNFSMSFKPKVNSVSKSKELSVDKIQETVAEEEAEEQPKKSFVIPLIIENVWRQEIVEQTKDGAQKIIREESTHIEKEVQEEISIETNQDTSKYGLVIMKPSRKRPLVEGEKPLLFRNKVPGIDALQDEIEKVKYDIQARPTDIDSKAYERIPVEEFGLAMLKGMGWKEGVPIGRNKKGLLNPVEYVRRPEGLGLGASADVLPKKPEPKSNKQYPKSMKQRQQEEKKSKVMVAARDAHGISKNTQSIGEKLVAADTYKLRIGAYVKIIHGTYKNLYGQVHELDKRKGYEMIMIGLKNSRKNVYIRSDDIVVIDGKAYNSVSNPMSKLVTLNEEKTIEHHTNSTMTKDNAWLQPDIKVKIISQSFKNGIYYKHKVVVHDVPDLGLCHVLTQDGRQIYDVPQQCLETVIPSVGKLVKIVQSTSEFCGNVAKLLQRHDDKDTAIVQLLGDLDIINVKLDDICEYVGPV